MLEQQRTERFERQRNASIGTFRAKSFCCARKLAPYVKEICDLAHNASERMQESCADRYGVARGETCRLGAMSMSRLRFEVVGNSRALRTLRFNP